MTSLLVFTGTFLAWAQVNQLIDGLSIVDVIDPGAATGSADEQNILLVGLDTRTDAQGIPLPQSILDQLHAGGGGNGGDNTDTMILIHIPAGGANAVAFSIPRDSYVQLAGGYGTHKINSAYTYAQVAAAGRLRAAGVGGAQLNVQAAQAGAKNAIQTVQQLTGLTVNHFASVNLVGFYDISQAVGGVPVCLKAPVDDSYSGARFPAGPQTISGAQALAFVRQRHGLPNGDLDRIRRQQAFMAGMAYQVLSAGTLTDPAKLTGITDAVKKTVTIDQGWDPLSFAQQLRTMSLDKIQFQTIPVVNVDYQTPDGDAVEVDPAAVKAFIAKTIASTGSGGASSTAPGSPPVELRGSADVTIDVNDGSGIDGLADRVLRDLGGHGYTAGTIADVSSRKATAVEYASGKRADAEKIVQYLGSGATVDADPALRAGHLRIVLGSAYTGPDSRPDGAITGSSSSTPLTANGQTCVN